MDDFNILDELSGLSGLSQSVNIRVQQRNARKCITTCQGLENDLDLKKILKHVKKKFSCNGVVAKTDDGFEIIQLQGDVRKQLAEFLIFEKICGKTDVKIHGF
jgi:translation initiation factor 1